MPKQPFFVKTGLYKPFLFLSKPFNKIYTLMTFLEYVDKNKKKGFINDYYNKKAKYIDRFKLHEILQNELKINEKPINYLEFGVAKGDMIKFWVSRNTNENSSFIGFDSFEGLPEDWGHLKKGHFDTQNILPDISDDRVRFVKGWFQDTAYKVLEKFNFSNQTIFHLDADLFSSTLYILFQIHPFIKKGDILIFDEFSSYEDEFLALETFKRCTGKDWKFEFIGAINNFSHIAIQIK